MRSGERRGTEGDRAPVLQTAVLERAWLRGGQRRRDHGASAIVCPAPGSRHRQVRRERCWPARTLRELSEPEEAQPAELRPGHRPRHTDDRILLPGTAAAQHPRLSDIRGRVQSREKILQAVHHRTHESWFFLISEVGRYKNPKNINRQSNRQVSIKIRH